MPTAVTLTMNPAVDSSASVDRVVPDRKLRCGPPQEDPGGGGINVSRVLRRLGTDAPAVYPSGGPPGQLLGQLLDREDVTHWPVPVKGWTRENWNFREDQSGRQYRFCMPGPELSEEEAERCLALLRGVHPRPAYVVASGSLPPGVDPGFYARVARMVRESSSRLLLDSSGEPLRLALEEGVYLWKPSLREFEHLAGVAGGGEDGLVALARGYISRGACEILVLSLGAEGALWVTAAESQHVRAPEVPVSSGVGAGDSLLAGIVHAMTRGEGLAEAVRYGVAAAAASVMHPGTRLCRREDVEALLPALVAG